MTTRVRRTMALAAHALLAGCAAVGVPASDDPWTKYLQGCALLESGRVFPAYSLLTESLEHYERDDKPMQLAMVQLSYATLLGAPAFVIHPQFHERRMALGGREALPDRARELVVKARDNLSRSLDGPSPAEWTPSLVLLAEAQARLGERREACDSLRRAAASFRDAGAAHFAYGLYGYRTLDELLIARMRLLECAGEGR